MPTGAGADLARARLALGDTEAPYDLSDATLETTLEAAPTRVAAMVELAEALAALYARRAQTERQGDLSQSFGDRARSYEAMALRFASRGVLGEAPRGAVRDASPVALPRSDQSSVEGLTNPAAGFPSGMAAGWR